VYKFRSLPLYLYLFSSRFLLRCYLKPTSPIDLCQKSPSRYHDLASQTALPWPVVNIPSLNTVLRLCDHPVAIADALQFALDVWHMLFFFSRFTESVSKLECHERRGATTNMVADLWAASCQCPVLQVHHMDSTLADFDVFDLWSHINTMMETYQESYVYEVSTMLYFRWFIACARYGLDDLQGLWLPAVLASLQKHLDHMTRPMVDVEMVPCGPLINIRDHASTRGR
jgi:hypothetical protein